jgi:phytoene dehydrogenase-like protein
MVWCYSNAGDPTIAPEGMHSAGSECYTCAGDQFSEKEWAQYDKAHAEYIVDKWSQYAPNMTWDNTVGYDISNPLGIFRLPHTPFPGVWNMLDGVPSQLGWNRPIPELSDHRTPIKGLYGTGSGWHPFGSAASGGGYTCYRVIAEDHGLRKPWEEKGREY